MSLFSRAAVGAYHKLKFIFREYITQNNDIIFDSLPFDILVFQGWENDSDDNFLKCVKTMFLFKIFITSINSIKSELLKTTHLYGIGNWSHTLAPC